VADETATSPDATTNPANPGRPGAIGAIGAPGAPLGIRRGRSGSTSSARGDAVFRGLTAGVSALVFVIIVAIAVFLVLKAGPALNANKANFFTEKGFSTENRADARFGIAALVYGTMVSAFIAVLLAVPVALGVALYVTQYAHPRLARPVGYIVDLLAAVPSVVFGLWGLVFLAPRLKGLQEGLASWFGWTGLFSSDGQTTKSILLASIILAVMILPIVSAICREVFVQVPAANREAALALGATRLEMIRLAVLPYSRAGVVSAIMLGLGRALGETIAVALTLSTVLRISPNLLGSGDTIAANIAVKFGDSSPTGRSALIATGLVLFVITLVVNLAARTIVGRAQRSAA
jgi:phosphate transport system permease protein